MIKKGNNYTKSYPEVISFVDSNFPHAIVDEFGNWFAESNPFFAPNRKDLSNDIAFVFSTDKNYYPGLVVALRSLLELHDNIPIIIIERDLSEMQKRYLTQFAQIIPARRFIPEHVAWDRFDISFLKYKRIVFLDCDIVILNPLNDFINSKSDFSAVKNLNWTVKENFKTSSALVKYGIPFEKPAFFAGGFSINNEVWGNGRLFYEASELFYSEWNEFIYGDQSALQIIMYRNNSKIEYLDETNNALAECWDWKNRRNDAKVIHYTGELKPWHKGSNQLEEKYLFKYSKIVNE